MSNPTTSCCCFSTRLPAQVAGRRRQAQAGWHRVTSSSGAAPSERTSAWTKGLGNPLQANHGQLPAALQPLAHRCPCGCHTRCWAGSGRSTPPAAGGCGRGPAPRTAASRRGRQSQSAGLEGARAAASLRAGERQGVSRATSFEHSSKNRHARLHMHAALPLPTTHRPWAARRPWPPACRCGAPAQPGAPR